MKLYFCGCGAFIFRSNVEEGEIADVFCRKCRNRVTVILRPDSDPAVVVRAHAPARPVLAASTPDVVGSTT